MRLPLTDRSLTSFPRSSNLHSTFLKCSLIRGIRFSLKSVKNRTFEATFIPAKKCVEEKYLKFEFLTDKQITSAVECRSATTTGNAIGIIRNGTLLINKMNK